MNHKPMKMRIALLLACVLLVSHLPVVSVFAVDGVDQTAQTEPVATAEASLWETQASQEAAETASAQPETQGAETEAPVALQEAAVAYALDQTAVVDGVAIRLTAVDGVFPQGARLEVRRAGTREARIAEAAVAAQREEGRNVALSYTFDIKVVDREGNELQPADESLVQLSFALAQVENQNLDAQVYHLTEDMPGGLSAQELDVQTVGNVATVETDGFSFYTVEFTYEDKEYVLQGGRYVRLYDILNFVGLTGEVESWEISNNELFTILRGDETGIWEESVFIGDDEIVTPVDDPNGTVLYLLSFTAFDTKEWVKVVIDGIEYEIVVTDDNTQHGVPQDGYSGTISTNNDNNPAMINDPIVPRDNGVYSYPNYVKQSASSSSATDFAAGLPLSTIFIDTSMIGHTDNKGVQGVFTLLTNNSQIAAGFEYSYSENDGELIQYNPLKTTDDQGNSISLMQLEPNKVNVLEGDLFQLIYKNAAILPNGDRAHLKIVYSNAKIVIDRRLGVGKDDLTAEDFTALGIDSASFELEPTNYQGAVFLVRGASVTRGGTDKRNLSPNGNKTGAINDAFTIDQRKAMVRVLNAEFPSAWGNSYTNANSNTAYVPSLGQSIDVKYQVVDDAGNPVNGTFIYAITGINLDRDPYVGTGDNVCKPLWGYSIDNPELHFHSEALSINAGKVSDYIYIRPNTDVYEPNMTQAAPGNYKKRFYYCQVIDRNGKPTFIGNGYGGLYGGDDPSYNSGFVLLVDATEGISVTITGHGSAINFMNTQAYGGAQIWYRYTSFSGPNGTIQTTSEGNYGGTLNDTSDSGVSSSILDPNTYVVPEGKTVTYTMTPNDGFQIAKLEIMGKDGGIQEISLPWSTMNPGDIFQFKDAAGQYCTLTALSDGKFKLEIPYAKHDEEVHVYWERIQAKVTVKKETEANKTGSFPFKIKAHKKEDVVSYVPVQVGSIWREKIGTEIVTETVTDPDTGVETTIEVEKDIFGYKTAFEQGVTCTETTTDSHATQELIMAVSDAMLMESVVIPPEALPNGHAYPWGASLWKTNVKLSDLGITCEGKDDDTLFVGFANVPSAPALDSLGTALNIGYSIGPERIYFYHPVTTIEKDVEIYWNFDTEQGQSIDPGWYEFTLNNGGEREFLIQKKYEYEVYEETQTGWELVSVDGVFGARKAIGYLSEETHSAPEHIFKNRKLPDLTIKKTTENDAPGSFDFIVQLTQAAVPAQSYQLTATAVVENGVIRYTFTNNGTAFSMNGMVIPTGETTYADGTLLDSVFVKLLNLSSASTDAEKKITLGTEDGTVSTDAAQSLKSWAEEKKTAQIAALDAGACPDIDGPESVLFTFEASGKDERPYDFGDTLPIGVSKVDASDLSKGYKVTVRSGTPFTLVNLPHGVTYEIVEDVPIHWQQLSSANDSGNLTDDVTATFHNRQFLELTVAKTLVGNQASRDKYFKFTVKLENCVRNSQLTLDMTMASQAPVKTVATAYEAADMATANRKDDDALAEGQQISVDGEGKAQFDVYLQHGQSILIKGIPYGASYTVTEVPEDYQPSLVFAGDDCTNDSATEPGNTIVIGTYEGNPGAEDSFLKLTTTLTFKNTRSGAIPTGVRSMTAPAVTLALLATGLGSLVLIPRRRRRNYE